MTDWQGRSAAFAQHHGLFHDPATHALDLVSEVGEVAKEILLAEVCGVNADDALNATLQKYERRLADHGDTGSA
jgi:hypothetical protein